MKSPFWFFFLTYIILFFEKSICFYYRKKVKWLRTQNGIDPYLFSFPLRVMMAYMGIPGESCVLHLYCNIRRQIQDKNWVSGGFAPCYDKTTKILRRSWGLLSVVVLIKPVEWSGPEVGDCRKLKQIVVSRGFLYFKCICYNAFHLLLKIYFSKWAKICRSLSKCY